MLWFPASDGPHTLLEFTDLRTIRDRIHDIEDSQTVNTLPFSQCDSMRRIPSYSFCTESNRGYLLAFRLSPKARPRRPPKVPQLLDLIFPHIHSLPIDLRLFRAIGDDIRTNTRAPKSTSSPHTLFQCLHHLHLWRIYPLQHQLRNSIPHFHLKVHLRMVEK